MRSPTVPPVRADAGRRTVARGLLREYLLVGMLAAVIAVVVVRWVGGVTIYQAGYEERRAELHQAILTNTVPEGKTWGSLGANSLNLRVATVWMVELGRKITGWRLGLLYQVLALACLTLGLLLLHALVRRWLPLESAIAGMLLMGALLPLTSFLHVFHPWDRPTFALWAGMALAAVAGRYPLLLALFTVAVVVKFDSLFAAGLPFFLAADRRNIRAPLARSALLAAVGVGIMALLSTLYPGGQEPRDLATTAARNLDQVRELGLAYPPLLTHGLLATMGVLGWRQGDLAARRLWLFGLCLLLPHALFTNFVEVRAQVGSTICMIPLALFAFRQSGPRPGTGA